MSCFTITLNPQPSTLNPQPSTLTPPEQLGPVSKRYKVEAMRGLDCLTCATFARRRLLNLATPWGSGNRAAKG